MIFVVSFLAAISCFIFVDETNIKFIIFAYIFLFISVSSTIFLFIGDDKMESSSWQYGEEPYSTEHIVALSDNNMISGKFYIRSGYIDENLYYQYLVKLNSGGFVANKVKASNTTLFYDTDNYRVEWYTRTKKWLYFEKKENYVKIYIPEDSISSDFSVDLN